MFVRLLISSYVLIEQRKFLYQVETGSLVASFPGLFRRDFIHFDVTGVIHYQYLSVHATEAVGCVDTLKVQILFTESDENNNSQLTGSSCFIFSEIHVISSLGQPGLLAVAVASWIASAVHRMLSTIRLLSKSSLMSSVFRLYGIYDSRWSEKIRLCQWLKEYGSQTTSQSLVDSSQLAHVWWLYEDIGTAGNLEFLVLSITSLTYRCNTPQYHTDSSASPCLERTISVVMAKQVCLVPEKDSPTRNTTAVLGTSECESVSAKVKRHQAILLEGHCLNLVQRYLALSGFDTLMQGCHALHIEGALSVRSATSGHSVVTLVTFLIVTTPELTVNDLEVEVDLF
ncbi:hypothetical protein CLF_102280 [Clonorchis sinensis]|uniref:Uncharacterized protein n=1 Tax=Clonorchis sinensis TaxID=79923 RepID=G7Y7N6_CLOSI|nr:hypothetical protein CLF_102280 [Clonorchis sinensis]